MASKKTGLNWKSLKHAHGPATRVPEQVKALLSASASERDEAYVTLVNTLIGDDTWFSGSSPAVAVLLDSLDGSPEPHRILLLVADILGANHVRVWKLGVKAAARPEATQARQEAVSRKNLLFDASQHGCIRS